MGLFDFFKKKQSTSQSSSKSDNYVDESKALEIVDKLEGLGYFKYADENDILELKKEVFRSLQKNYLGTVWNEHNPYNAKDYRFYSLDGETLFEQDGFLDYLHDFSHLFKLIDFKIQITNHIEEYDYENEWLNHSLTINDKDYIIFSKFKGYGWGGAAQKFADILNDQLYIQGKEERIYLSNGANDGYAVVLSQAIYNIIDPFLKDLRDRPLKTSQWCDVMQVKPI